MNRNSGVPTTIGGRIRYLRERKGWRANELAKAVGVSPSRMSVWENDKEPPNEDSIVALAQKLDSTPAFIRYGVTESAPADQRRQEAIESVDLDRRRAEILADANLSVHEKSMLLLDLTLSLRAEAMRDFGRAALLQEEEASRRRHELAEVQTHVMPKRRVTREDIERNRRTG